ncbi:MAG: hypothetical protein IPJ77_00130 [Planctomycetes bacterium]|nr:hypothetical protein [Planctomycetota bacterium]
MATRKTAQETGPTDPTTTQTSASGGGLLLLGIGLAGAGVALALGPGLAPTVAPWVATLTKHGATPALVGATGVLVAAIGLATRALSRHSNELLSALGHLPSPERELEALGSEIAQIRGSLQELRVESVYLKDGIAGLQQGLGEELSSGHRQGMQEAVFQMAGSLDQMGARIEERLALQHDVFTQALQTFHNSLLTACLRIDELYGRVSTAAPGTNFAGEVASARPDSLGVLDLMDDPPAPVPHRPHRIAVPTGHVSTAAQPAPALPAPVITDPAIASTVAYLQNLFADDRVRQAYAHLQQTGGL